jgi:L-asparaginase
VSRHPRPRVAVIFTGGTISMTVDSAAGGAVPTLAGAELLARVTGLEAIAEIVAIDRGRIPASHFSFADVLAIGGAIDAALADPGLAGVVVVQGTDTLEETAFVWDLCHVDARPVVVTGAMRNASEPGWDGPANLRSAVRVAAHPETRGGGVLVVLAGRVIAADDVAKRHSSALDAFASRGGRPLGRVGERGVTLSPRGPRRRLHPAPTAAGGPVEIVVAALETDGRALDRAIAGGARAVVVAATGGVAPNIDAMAARSAAKSLPSTVSFIRVSLPTCERVTSLETFMHTLQRESSRGS